jgi:ABC-type sugar transport system ATPase subunit
MASVAFEHVDKTYPGGTRALRDVCLEVGDGELVVVIGSSGCGNDESPQQRNVAMVFQDYALYPHMTVRRNLEFPLRMRGLSRDELRRRVDRAAELLEIGALLERRPAQLSGGQRQRAAMGRALVREPSVFLLDEPLSNLDAKLRAQVRAEIGELQRRTRATMLYVTHDQVEAMALAQRVAVLDRGRLEQVAPPRELYERPANTFVAGFIGSPPMNLFPARVEAGGEGWLLALGEQRAPVDASPRLCAEAKTAGVRPEALSIAPDGAAGALAARVDEVEGLGHETLAHLSLPDASRPGGRIPLVARLPGLPALGAGDAVRVRIDPSRVHFFDAAGRALS